MRYGIVGSRSRTDKESIESFVSTLSPGDIVISGGCQGVDTWAVNAARGRNLQVIEFLPNTKGCKQRFEFTKAFYARNKQIAANCDTLVAFVAKNRKGGTENTIKHAQRLGKKIHIIPPPQNKAIQ